jgi:GNAT superfamily N-acetyltransferase
MGADLSLPTPGVYGVLEQWPHVGALLERVGFVRGDRTELVYLAEVDRLPTARPVPELEIARTLGVAGTRFTALLDASGVGYLEVDTGIGGTGRIASDDGWADIGNLQVDLAHRRRGVGTRLLAEVGDWLRLARIPRLLDYATPDEAEHRAFLERHGFRLLTRTHREWTLPT